MKGPHLPCQECHPGPDKKCVSLYLFNLLSGTSICEGRNSDKKMWICLFTCLAIRAIHLEWVRSLSGEQLLQCLRRFMARQRRPEMIISDNAAQFKLVIDEQWRQIALHEDVVTYNGIKWQFTMALAP